MADGDQFCRDQFVPACVGSSPIDPRLRIAKYGIHIIHNFVDLFQKGYLLELRVRIFRHRNRKRQIFFCPCAQNEH